MANPTTPVVKRYRSMDLPMVTTDSTLVKSTSENNKANTSKVTEYGHRTPNKIDIDPIPLPPFTPERGPEDKKFDEKTKTFTNYWEDAEIRAWSEKVDHTTPIEQLILPKTDLLNTPEAIEKWIRKNYTFFNTPNHYAGHEANTDSPDTWATADLRILIVRLSTYDAVNGSMTHGAIAQMSRQAATEGGWKQYIDHAYMPGLTKDVEILQENKIPWWFGRTSKRHPREFDVILISNALTLEIWNLIPGLIWSGIAPFKTMRMKEKKIGDPEGYPVIILGGVVSDFVESLYGKCGGQECVPDITCIGDGEYILPRTLNLLQKCKAEGKTKAEFLRLGHDLPEEHDFERDDSSKGKCSWWYEPDLYEHIWQTDPDPKTGYRELLRINRKPGHEYAAAPGYLKRAVVRDLNETAVWEETPLLYSGSLGDSADVQISSGCLCIADDEVGEPSYIETDMGFERIKDAYARLKDEDEVGGVLVQTRQALQSAEKIVHTGKKRVRTYTFRDEHDKHRIKITCTDDHKFDTTPYGDSEITWTRATNLTAGQEVWACDPEIYKAARESAGRMNNSAQHYYSQLITVELFEVSDEFEAECYDVLKCEIHEYIANGMITHNSGGLCSFCLAEGTLVSLRGGEQIPIEKLDDIEFEGDLEEREFDTPWGLQLPQGVGLTGEKPCIKITTEDGRSIICTPDHEMVTTRDGKVLKIKAGDLVAGQDVLLSISTITKATIARDSGKRDFLYPEMLGSRKQQKAAKAVENQVAKAATAAGNNADTAVMTANKIRDTENKTLKEILTRLRKANTYTEKITSIEDAGIHKVYDVWNITRGHMFYANGYIVGNCSAAETEVVLADGRTLPITDIKVGTPVRMVSGKIAPVTGRYEREVDEIIGVWQTERMQYPVRTTLNHKFPALKKFNHKTFNLPVTWDEIEDIPLGELEEGDFLTGPESDEKIPTLVEITRLEHIHYKGKVYNLEIGDEDHSYKIGPTTIPEEVKALLEEIGDSPTRKQELLALLQEG